MLKKRSRPASSGGAKHSLMSEKYSLSSPKPPNSTLFPSPRVFVGVGFSPKGFAEVSADAVFAMSPTSILETTKPFNKNPTTKPAGLGIADALKEPSRPESRMVLFGSQLRIQVPSLSTTPVAPLQSSPIEFGIKNKSTQLALHSPAAAAARRSTTGPTPAAAAAGLVSGSLSATEMEMSEDYTRVIAHGPNPKTTHIFDNCVVESCCRCGRGFVPAAAARKEKEEGSVPAGDDFLTSCDVCKKSLEQGKDVFTYRGEKAFCSLECRYQEMLFDEDMEYCEPDQTAIL